MIAYEFNFKTNNSPRGCVTPPVLHNWWESAGEDFELIDGLDTLPDDAQEKVKRALQQGHVDDEDFSGVCSPVVTILKRCSTNHFTGC